MLNAQSITAFSLYDLNFLVFKNTSGKNSQFTDFERIEKDSPMDTLLHTKEFMELSIVLKEDMVRTLDDEYERRKKILASRKL